MLWHLMGYIKEDMLIQNTFAMTTPSSPIKTMKISFNERHSTIISGNEKEQYKCVTPDSLKRIRTKYNTNTTNQNDNQNDMYVDALVEAMEQLNILGFDNDGDTIMKV
jgi:hypothetical protein